MGVAAESFRAPSTADLLMAESVERLIRRFDLVSRPVRLGAGRQGRARRTSAACRATNALSQSPVQ
jgi:hypothetical protein